MKSVLPVPKFNLHAQKPSRRKRLEAPLNGPSPSALPGSAIRKDPPTNSPAAKLLGHLDQLSKPRVRLYNSPISAFPHHRWPQIPRYIFVGDQPGESEIRLGLFAGLRGENQVGAKAIVEFMDDLVAMPSLGSAFRIYAYPTVNPLSSTTGARGRRTDRSVVHQGWAQHRRIIFEPGGRDQGPGGGNRLDEFLKMTILVVFMAKQVFAATKDPLRKREDEGRCNERK